MANIVVGPVGQAFIDMMQPLIEQAIQNAIGFNIAKQDYTEYYPQQPINSRLDGDELVVGFELIGGKAVAITRGESSRSAMLLRNIPVRPPIISVAENPGAWDVAGGDWPATSILPTNAYYLDQMDANYCWTGILWRSHGVWDSSIRSIKIVYTAGLTPTEISQIFPEITLATLVSIENAFLTCKIRSLFGATGGISSTGIPDFNVSFRNPRDVGLDMDHLIPARAACFPTAP